MKTRVKSTSSFPAGGAESNGIASNKKAQVQTAAKNSDGNPKAPPEKCHNCGYTRFWLRDNGYGPPEWLCTRCHPSPLKEEVITSDGLGDTKVSCDGCESKQIGEKHGRLLEAPAFGC